MTDHTSDPNGPTDPTLDERRLAALLADARALPREIAPPPELHARVRRAALAARPADGRGHRWQGLAAWRRAAAVLLLAGTAGSAWWMGRSAGREEGRDDARAVARAADSVPVTAVAATRDHEMAIAEMHAILERERADGTLAPETVAIVERNLRIIDAAILEARAAVARDPGSRAAVELLRATYVQKADLLRQALATLTPA